MTALDYTLRLLLIVVVSTGVPLLCYGAHQLWRGIRRQLNRLAFQRAERRWHRAMTILDRRNAAYLAYWRGALK